MSGCLINALTYSMGFGLMAGFLVSFLIGPFSAMGKRADTRSGWEARKVKYGGAGKAWFTLLLTIAIPAFIILAIGMIIECF